MLSPPQWLTLAACLHFLQLPATSWLARRSLNLHCELGRLSALNARVVLVFMGAVSFLVIGLAVLILLDAPVLLTTALGRRLCVLLGLFWLARAAAQVWLHRYWPTDTFNRKVYAGLFGLYLLLGSSYLAACDTTGAFLSARDQAPGETPTKRLKERHR